MRRNVEKRAVRVQPVDAPTGEVRTDDRVVDQFGPIPDQLLGRTEEPVNHVARHAVLGHQVPVGPVAPDLLIGQNIRRTHRVPPCRTLDAPPAPCKDKPNRLVRSGMGDSEWGRKQVEHGRSDPG